MAGRVHTNSAPPLVSYGCDFGMCLRSDFLLQVADQIRCGFTGELLEGRSVELAKQGLDVLLVILSSFG